MQLENWSISNIPQGPYNAPETFLHTLSGEVFGHPGFEDGERVSTSAIKRVSTLSVGGTEIQTESGSVYILGEPAEAYVEWCREQGCHIPTPEEPIKMIGDE